MYILDSTGATKTIGYSYNGSGGYPAPSSSSTYREGGYINKNTSYRTLEFYNTSKTKLVNLFAFYNGCVFVDENGLAYCIGKIILISEAVQQQMKTIVSDLSIIQVYIILIQTEQTILAINGHIN